MKSGKDEEKGMHPLFPRLHINDADKGGPKPPPRNKMALCDQYNMHSETPRFNSSSTPTKNRAIFSPQVSSSNHKILPSFCSLPPRSSHLTERYHSYYPTGINLNSPQTNSETLISEPIDYQTIRSNENVFQKSCYVEPRNHTSSSHKAWTTPSSAVNSDDHHKRCSFMNERMRLNDRYAEVNPDVITRKRCASEMDNSLHSFPEFGDKNGQTDVENTNFGDKKQKFSDNLEDYSLPCLELTPNDVVGVIGQKLFWKARNIIVHQQRVFAMQIFDLHRLIKVQKLIAGSSKLLRENNFNLNEPSIKFPPIEKLLYVTPLDTSPVVTKPKPEANNDENRYPKPSPKPGPTTNAKTTPWCFNQWLIPVKSPSEGLIYKPYTGPCPPGVGIMAPVLPIGLNPTAYNVSGPKSYFQTYPMPLINPITEVDQTALVHEPAVPDKTLFPLMRRNSSNVLSQQDSSGSSPNERVQGDVLSLFPTKPSFQYLNVQPNEQKVQVIKVVPHNRKSAPESAARIFQSIQEERNRT